MTTSIIENSVLDRVLGVYNDLLKRELVNNYDDFANKCKFSPTSFSQILKGKRRVPASLQRGMIQAFSVNPEYIYEGEGKMYLKADKYVINPRDRKVNLGGAARLAEREAMKAVPHYDTESTAGNEIIIFEGQAKQYIKEYIQVGAFSDCELVINVRGNSMYPKWCAGEMIALKRIKDWDVIAFGEAHVVVTEEQVLLKYVDPSGEKGIWTLRSENPSHHPFDIPRKKVKHLFIVKGKVVVHQM